MRGRAGVGGGGGGSHGLDLIGGVFAKRGAKKIQIALLAMNAIQIHESVKAMVVETLNWIVRSESFAIR